MINNLEKGYDCASTLKDILERKQIIDNYHLTGYHWEAKHDQLDSELFPQ